MKKYVFFLIAFILPMFSQAECISFSQNLSHGSSGEDVFLVQQILNADKKTQISETGVGSPGNETDFYGHATTQAMRRFQALFVYKNKPVAQQSGMSDTATREMLRKVSCELPIRSVSSLYGSGACHVFPKAAEVKKVLVEQPITYTVVRGQRFSLSGKNFTDNNTIDIGKTSICAQKSETGTSLDFIIPTDAPLGDQILRVVNAYGASNLIHLFILETQPKVNSSRACTSISRTLTQGASNADVKKLQVFLNSDEKTMIALTGAGSPGQESTYFGPATKRAVQVFQQIYKNDVLAPAKLTAPNGVVGPLTIRKIKSLSGCPQEQASSGNSQTTQTGNSTTSGQTTGGQTTTGGGQTTTPPQTSKIPKLTSVTPNPTQAEKTISLSGESLTSYMSVYIDGVRTGYTTSLDDTASVSYVLPKTMTADKHTVAVSNTFGKSNALSLSINYGKTPHLNTITPATGETLQTISLTGENLQGSSIIISENIFSETTALNVSISSTGNSATFTIPTGLTSGSKKVKAKNAEGVSNELILYVTSKNPPHIQSLNPTTEIEQGETLLITGSGFLPSKDNEVFIETIDPATEKSLGLFTPPTTLATKLSIPFPRDLRLGEYVLFVKHKYGQSNKKEITVVSRRPPELINAYSQIERGSEIALTGKYFEGTNTVRICNQDVTGVSSTNGYSAQLVVPRTVPIGTCDMTLTNSRGTSNTIRIAIVENGDVLPIPIVTDIEFPDKMDIIEELEDKFTRCGFSDEDVEFKIIFKGANFDTENDIRATLSSQDFGPFSFDKAVRTNFSDRIEIIHSEDSDDWCGLDPDALKERLDWYTTLFGNGNICVNALVTQQSGQSKPFQKCSGF